MASKLDIVIIGATGYTGRIACKYLSTHRDNVSWGIAGRSEAKLNELKASLGADKVKTFVVDFNKPETLDAVCAQAKCIITCAGPFNLCGMPVVEACVRNSVHYIDSTGEFTFVRRAAERFHEEAKKKKITLSSCCGFDCVPSDIGNYVVHREAKEELKEVKAYFTLKHSGMSSGTAISIAEIVNHFTKQDFSRTSLNPVGAVYKAPVAAPMWRSLWYDRSVRSWTAPYVMAGGNERLVRRTNALMGSTASYVECMQAGFLRSLAATLGFYAMGFVLAVKPLRNYLFAKRYPTGVAYGPAADAKKDAFFKATFHATTVSGKKVTTTLYSTIEMYDITGIFLVECALSALTLEKKGTLVPGYVTPAAGFGDELVRRARDAGLKISTVLESTQGDKKSA